MKYPLCAKRLQEALYNKGMTQQDLSDITGISKASISQYINGHHCPTNTKAVIIGKALGVPPEWLMGFDVMKGDKCEVETSNSVSNETKKRLKAYMDAFISLSKDRQDIILKTMEAMKGSNDEDREKGQ